MSEGHWEEDMPGDKGDVTDCNTVKDDCAGAVQDGSFTGLQDKEGTGTGSDDDEGSGTGSDDDECSGTGSDDDEGSDAGLEDDEGSNSDGSESDVYADASDVVPIEYYCDIPKTEDALYLRLMKLQEKCASLRDFLNKLMRNGFHNIATSRYVMDSNRVGSAQLPGPGDTVTAKNTIQSQELGQSDYRHFTLCYQGDIHSYAEVPPVVTSTGGTLGANPLDWFGVLVPGQLRHAQSTFQQALQIAVQVKNLEQGILATCQQYDIYLQRQKKKKREAQR